MIPNCGSSVVTAALVALVLLGTGGVASAQSSPSIGYVLATNTGCKVGRPSVKADDSVTWQGKCMDGLASGPGVAQWSNAGKPTLRYEGSFEKGVLEGKGVMTGAEGDRYDGTYKAGLRHGFGTYVQANGARYEGEFRNNQRAGATSSALPQLPAQAPTAPPLTAQATSAPRPATPAAQAVRLGDPLPGKTGVEVAGTSGAVYRVEDCGGWPRVVGRLPKGFDPLTSTQSSMYHGADAKGGVFILIDEAISTLEAGCKLNPNNTPTVYLFSGQLPPPGSALKKDDKTIPVTAVRIGHSWQIENHALDADRAAKQAKTQADQRAAQQAEQTARAKQAADRSAASKAQFTQFVKKHGLVEKAVKGLSANPFAFEGQNLLIPTEFQQMQTATAGLFYVPDEGVIMVTDIPKATFAAKGKVLLAGKVTGNTPFDGVVGGLLPVKGMIPSIKYLGALICSDDRCGETVEK